MSAVLFDNIDTLPTDQNSPSHAEIQIVDQLFKQKHNTIHKILEGTKDIVVVGFIFLLFSLPQLDDILKKLIPATEKSSYVLIAVKALFFMFVYFLVKNLYLVRKRK